MVPPILEDNSSSPRLSCIALNPSSTSSTLLSERIASLTLENQHLKMKNIALEQSTNELLAENQHLQLDITSVCDLEQLREDNLRLEQQLDNAIRKKRELRAKNRSLYAWNSRMHKQLADLKERLRLAESRSLPDYDYADSVARSESPILEDGSQSPAASREDATASRDVATGSPSAGVIVFSPTIPMTPIVGIDGSRYISLYTERRKQWQQIERAAYVHRTGNDVVVPCKLMVNNAFRPKSVPKNAPMLSYVGFTYPDKTSLCYIPVSNVVIQYRNNVGHVSRGSQRERTWTAAYGRTHVFLGMNKDVYKALVSRAFIAYRRKSAGAGSGGRCATDTGEVQEVDETVWFNAGMKNTCTVQIWRDRKYEKKSVARALKEKGQDIRGDAVLYMRFSVKEEGDSVPTLSFRFHTLNEAVEKGACWDSQA